ncbi:MAG: glycoside hydrolase family 20 zincin-like fold domain-containing protein, partial [Kiritimatiellae bacterium]|nr:glycoside hydrolase family 20 zincin-like fold domain-containing protein [Kiritimatiellia bacterium]
MKKRTAIRVLIVLSLAAAAGGELSAKTVDLQQGDEALWQREVLPLPQEIRIAKVQRLKPGEVAIRGQAGASGLEQVSISNVVNLFRQKTGVAPEGKQFEIVIGVMDANGKVAGVDVPQGARLKDVPNRDQAYVIQPAGSNMLVVAAVAPRGLYYGTRTLCQWLEFHLSRETAEIPLACVVDWPDLEERGFWHMPSYNIPWLASLKMNRFYEDNLFAVDKTGIHPYNLYYNWPAVADENPEKHRQACAAFNVSYEKARQYAAELVPGPTHMDFWAHKCAGYKEAYPGLLGQGESAHNTDAQWKRRVPCATNPDLVKVLTIIMTNMAAQKASEVMAWMSEYAGQCECAECMKEGQFRAEVRAAVEAWKEAKKTYPDLKLSVFFGIGGFGPNSPKRYPDAQIKDIVTSLPPEVTMRASMGCDGPDGNLLKKFAAQGKRIARFNVTSYLSMIPTRRFSSEDVRERMREIAADKYIGAWQFTRGGYITDNDGYRKTFSFRLSALAEYSWNANGRNEKQFAEAWATRQGYKNPEKILTLLEALMIPQVARELDCWTGKVFASTWLGNLPTMAAEKKWDNAFFTAEAAEQGVKKSEEAVALAVSMGAEDLAAEARRLAAYCRLELAGHYLVTALQNGAPGDAAAAALRQWQEAWNQYIESRKKVLALGISLGNAERLEKR